MWAQTPRTCQQANRAYTRPHGPYRSGTSRQGQPTRVRNRTPSIRPRNGHFRGRPRDDRGGSADTKTCHCASVRSCRAEASIVDTRTPGEVGVIRHQSIYPGSPPASLTDTQSRTPRTGTFETGSRPLSTRTRKASAIGLRTRRLLRRRRAPRPLAPTTLGSGAPR